MDSTPDGQNANIRKDFNTTITLHPPGKTSPKTVTAHAAAGALPAQRSPLWLLLLQSARYRLVALYVLVAVLMLAGLTLPRPRQPEKAPVAHLERRAFDQQMRLLREYSPRPVANDVVLIGIDETTEAVFSEPLSLWHIHYAKVLDAMRIAKPAAVGVDIVLPTQSYNDFLPGSDQALAVSIFRLQQVAKLVYVSGTDSKGAAVQPLPIHARFLDMAVNFGTDQQQRDDDEVARRFSERDLGQGGRVNTFAGQILRLLGRPVEAGHIDYSVGGPIDYMLMQDVIGLLQRGDEATLKSRFGGRIVLFGTFTVERDRWKLPVHLATFEKHGKEFDLGQPGVLLHAQVLRSHLAEGLLTPAPTWLAALLCLLAAATVFLRFSPGRALIGTVLLPILLLIVSLLFILKAQWLFPIAAVTTTLWLAFFLRAILDAIDSVIERTRLKRSFSGMVSPAVFEDINSGMLDPDAATTAEVCVIFSDIRGFTTLSEAMAPDQVMNVLQRYFDRMVKSVHRFDGTIDKFIGDGMMILFGAPRPTKDPCTDAVRCALDMLESLDQLNEEFEREGLPKLEIGIGINYGKVVVGNIGSSERHNYSAIGDAVNVAARIEGQTKELGRRILITESVVDRIGGEFNFEPLGERMVKGHSPVKVWGIRATRTTRAGTHNGAAA